MNNSQSRSGSVQIIKLTPPQIQALRDALPGQVGTGVLTTTNSIATFAMPEGVTYRQSDGTTWQPTIETVTRLVRAAFVGQLGTLEARKLDAVLAKLTDPARKHLRVVTEL